MRKHIAFLFCYGYLDLSGRSLDELKGLFAYLEQAAFEILRPQLEGSEPITMVLISGGPTLARFSGESEASSYQGALYYHLQAIIESYRRWGRELTMPEIFLEEKALFTITNLRNSFRAIEDEIDQNGVEITCICDDNHDAVPSDHWRREAREVLGDKARFITFRVVTCKRPYDRHLFNNGWLQELHSLMLRLKSYRKRKVNATVRSDANTHRRLGQFGSLFTRS